MLTSREIFQPEHYQVRFETNDNLSYEFCSSMSDYLEYNFKINRQTDSNGYIYFFDRSNYKILFWLCWSYYNYSLIINYQKCADNSSINLILEELDSDWYF